jgi:hypothetical protein
MYADEGSRPVGRSATQLAASGLIGVERTPVVQHFHLFYCDIARHVWININDSFLLPLSHVSKSLARFFNL